MRAEQQRLAAGARAEIDDHVVAPRRDQHADQLAAFVLHFEPPVDEPRMAASDGRPVDANAERRIGRRRDRRSLRLRAPPSAASRVAFIVLTRRSSGAGACHARASAARASSPYTSPSRSHSQSGTSAATAGGSGSCRRDLNAASHAASLALMAGVELAHREAEVAHRDGEREVARQRALRKRFERALAPQVRERAVGDQRAIAGAHLAVSAKECIQRRIGGRRRAARRARSRRRASQAGCGAVSLAAQIPQRQCGHPAVRHIESDVVHGTRCGLGVLADVSSSRDGSDVRP